MGDIYVATDGGYPVRVVFTGNGDVGSFGVLDAQRGTIVYQIDFSDFDQPVDIAPPEGCSAAGNSEFPILDDASEINNLGGIMTYKTNKPFADVVSFYKQEMVAAGWALDNEFSAEPVAQLSFSKDSRSVTISIVGDATSAALLVSIIE